MAIRIIEVKRAYLKDDEREFLFVASATERVLHYEELMLGAEEVRRYIAEHPLPEDKYFDVEGFIADLSCEGYVSITAEKEETSEYVAELLYELV